MEIRVVGDPVLRRRARAVARVNRSVQRVMTEMIEVMRKCRGVGLAAPQVGVSRRIIVVDVGDGPILLANPEILWTDGEAAGVEGCLSVPGYIGEVTRAERVRVTGLDQDGRQVWIEGDGLLARAFQHEIDHLDGVLFLDRATRVTEVTEEPEEVDGIE